MSAFVDAHCHIDLYEFPERIIALADEQRIYTIAVTNAPSVFAHTAQLTAGSKYVRPAIGLHPELVHSHKHEIDLFRRHLGETKYVGEVGLDYTTSDENVRLAQREILSTVADWVSQCGDKVLTIHSRRAVADVISILSGAKARMILHWFSGTSKELERAIASGFFFSVNSAMLNSAAGRKLVVQMPRDKVITETDGPFVKDGRGLANPTTVKATLAQLADLWGEPLAIVHADILGDFRRIVVDPSHSAPREKS
jgi:TatD DNase family protein